jgi:GTPase SAR1 family protein
LTAKKLSELFRWTQELKFAKKVGKLVIAGDGHTGKTSLIKVLTEGLTLEKQKDVGTYKRTPFLNIEAYRIFATGEKEPVKLQIYDLAGQIIPAHPLEVLDDQLMFNLDVCVLVFALDNYQSLMNISNWFKQIRDFIVTNRLTPPNFIIAGNKYDLVSSDEDITSLSEICEKIIKENDFFKKYFFVSALTGEGLEELFKEIYSYLFARYDILTSA